MIEPTGNSTQFDVQPSIARPAPQPVRAQTPFTMSAPNVVPVQAENLRPMNAPQPTTQAAPTETQPTAFAPKTFRAAQNSTYQKPLTFTDAKTPAPIHKLDEQVAAPAQSTPTPAIFPQTAAEPATKPAQKIAAPQKSKKLPNKKSASQKPFANFAKKLTDQSAKISSQKTAKKAAKLAKKTAKKIPAVPIAKTATQPVAKTVAAPTESKSRRVQPKALIRYAAVTVILAVSGYLAYDTWSTNRQVRETFGMQSVSATAGGSAMSPGSLDENSVSVNQKAAYTVAPDMPRILTIPAIGVEARVLSVGTTSDGNIDAPTSIHDTGWYNASAKPGTAGAAFVDGHMASENIGGVFDGLKKLKSGDTATIERGDGSTINYVVKEVETIDVGQLDMKKVLNVHGGADEGLNLMTCSGSYDREAKNYSARTVVYLVRQ